jgi:hypothetical protein
MAAFPPSGARTARTQTEVNRRLLHEHCKNELCGEDHIHVMLNGVHARSLEAIARAPRAWRLKSGLEDGGDYLIAPVGHAGSYRPASLRTDCIEVGGLPQGRRLSGPERPRSRPPYARKFGRSRSRRDGRSCACSLGSLAAPPFHARPHRAAFSPSPMRDRTWPQSLRTHSRL